jgi:hypothetical protein
MRTRWTIAQESAVPILTPDQLQALAPSVTAPAKPQPDPIRVCTIEPTDSGDRCRWCGFPAGSGHGKERK